MTDSPTGGLSPMMDMRCKLTAAENEIERLETALTIMFTKANGILPDGAMCRAIAKEALAALETDTLNDRGSNQYVNGLTKEIERRAEESELFRIEKKLNSTAHDETQKRLDIALHENKELQEELKLANAALDEVLKAAAGFPHISKIAREVLKDA